MTANFAQELSETYCVRPCQVLPNALWKTLPRVATAEVILERPQSAATHLELWSEGRLLVYWNDARRMTTSVRERLSGASLAVLHHDFLPSIPAALLPDRECFFRLEMRGVTPRHALPPGFAFAAVHPEAEADAIADLIRDSYEDLRPTARTVAGWADHPVFEPDLWIWVVDRANGQPAGLGIAEFDSRIKEGSLEWIQVLPSYRRAGLGAALVCELLSRLNSRARFTTVSGRVDSPARPGALYRRCGFSGDDTWWVLRSGD